MNSTEQPKCSLTVFHDGSCPLCRREIALVQKLTRSEAISYVDVSQVGADSVAPGLTGGDAMQRFHVRRGDGRMLNGAAAFLELWSRSPRFRFLQRVARWPSVVKLLDRLYTMLLFIRPTIARWVRRFES